MSDEIVIEGIEYVSSKRASDLSGYAQDYIGQLARAGYIDSKRIGGLWYVSMNSLQNYEKSAAMSKSRPQIREQANETDALISFDGKDYISAVRAAELTGYHQDYVGQLARGGTIMSRQVGNRWYVDREGIIAHKAEKDRLLGAVQAESVGISRISDESRPESQLKSMHGKDEYLTYTTEVADLMPLHGGNDSVEDSFEDLTPEDAVADVERQVIPIRVSRTYPQDEYAGDAHYNSSENNLEKSKNFKKAIFYSASGLTVLMVLGASLFLGITKLMDRGEQDKMTTPVRGALMASAAETLSVLGSLLEDLIVQELVYKRSE